MVRVISQRTRQWAELTKQIFPPPASLKVGQMAAVSIWQRPGDLGIVGFFLFALYFAL
jgi:hypothetical protein